MEEFSKRSSKTFDIKYLVPNLGKKKPNATLIEPSKWIALSGYPSIKFSFKNRRLIKKAIKQSDLVFIQGPALLSFLSIYYGNKFKKKTVLYHHIYPWELFAKFVPLLVNKLLFKIVKKFWIVLYNQCDLILVPYNDLIGELNTEKVTTKKMVARLGVDISVFCPIKDKQKIRKKLKLDSHAKIIGYVGRLSKEKNVEVLIQAIKKLDSPHVLLLLVGDGPKHLKQKIKSQVNCKITGFVNNVDEYLKAMDIFVMPSLTETTSLATLEAMSTGLPVICTKIGFMKNYIIKNYNGLFFPKRNATLLSIKLEKLLQNPEIRAKLGSNARKTIAYSFSWERSINRIKRLIEVVLNKKP